MVVILKEVRGKGVSELPKGPTKLNKLALKVSMSTISLNVKVSIEASRSYVYDASDGAVVSSTTVAALNALVVSLGIIGLLKASDAKVVS